SEDARRVLALSLQVLALSLEGLNGNVSPFLEPVVGDAMRDLVAKYLRVDLGGSYLWSLWTDKERPRALQDPFSFRTAGHVHAAAVDANSRIADYLRDQINSSDDNPAVIVGIQPDAGAPDQVKAYYVGPVEVTNPCVSPAPKPVQVSGAVIPTGNFDPLRWVAPLEETRVALSHVS